LRREAELKRPKGEQSQSILFYASASPRNDGVGCELMIVQPLQSDELR